MKFFSEPNHAVIERNLNKITKISTNKLKFKFDENGEYSTTDAKLIEKLKLHFRYEEEKPNKKAV